MTDVNYLVKQTATNNPYRESLSYLFRRLLWDLSPPAWTSRSHLKSILDVHCGKKAVIICNGPSLNKVDFEKLKHVYTFGLNKINLIFDRTDFRPSCITAVNSFVIDQNLDFFKTTEIPLFIDGSAWRSLKSNKNITYIPSTKIRKFSRDCSMSVYPGFTVTFVALQLAFHMGFTSVAIVGADHNFATKGPANLTVSSGAFDESHFHADYFSGGRKWQLPDLFESEVSYTMAKNMYEAFGRKIYNATEGGKLEIFDRISLEDFLNI